MNEFYECQHCGIVASDPMEIEDKFFTDWLSTAESDSYTCEACYDKIDNGEL